MRARAVALVLLLASVAVAEAVPLAALFPYEADLYAGRGVARLPLPTALLSACQPDLSDLRLFDLQDREMPYLLDSDLDDPTGENRKDVVEAEVLGVDRRHDLVDGQPRYLETYDISTPSQAPVGGQWRLRFASEHPAFVRKVSVYALAADATKVPLIESDSVFRMPRSDQEKTTIVLPSFTVGHLHVMLEGQEEFFLEPRFLFESEVAAEPRPPLRIPLTILAQETVDRVTRVTLARSGAVVPDAIEITTATPWLDRPVEVFEMSTGSPDRRIGTGRLRRIQNDAAVESLIVAIAPTHGDRLRIEIGNSDSPTVAEIGCTALLRHPGLIFVPPTVAADGRVGRLRYGGGRVYRPAYDVAPLQQYLVRPASPRSAAARLELAQLGAIRANPTYDQTPALQFALRPGAAVDVRLYRYQRPLILQPSPEGSARLRLTAEEMAQVQPDLADVRVVDSDGRQWPYLVSTNGEREIIPLPVETIGQGRVSRYSIALPPFAIHRLEIDVDATLVDRIYRLQAGGEEEAAVLARGRFLLSPDRLHALTIDFPDVRADSLVLVVENGDEAALTVRKVSTSIVFPELFVVAPAGRYTLLLGYPDAGQPAYELASARAAVLAVPAGKVERLELQPNPAFSQGARLREGETPRRILHQVLLWSALVIAVLVLGLVTLRAVRNEQPPQL